MLSVAFLGPYAGTIAGAVAPVFSAVAVFLVSRALKKIDGVKEDTQEVKDGDASFVATLEKRLAEAEGAIRGDLKNGVKERLDSIDSKIPDKK